MKAIDKPARSFFKSLSYRLVGTLGTCAIVYLGTHQWKLSLGAGLLDFVVKIILFYFHERLWDSVRWGRNNSLPQVIWFTGLSGAGKSVLATLLFERLQKMGYEVELLDGDEARTFFPATGFSRPERLKHLKYMAWIARKLESHGTIVIASFITPYEDARQEIRLMCKNYVEVYVDTSLETCEARDTKGLYKRARAGELAHFTGISDEFEIPKHADIVIGTEGSIENSFSKLWRALTQQKHLRQD